MHERVDAPEAFAHLVEERIELLVAGHVADFHEVAIDLLRQRPHALLEHGAGVAERDGRASLCSLRAMPQPMELRLATPKTSTTLPSIKPM